MITRHLLHNQSLSFVDAELGVGRERERDKKENLTHAENSFHLRMKMSPKEHNSSSVNLSTFDTAAVSWSFTDDAEE